MYCESNNSALGHICNGGGANVTNSPIMINPIIVHIHIHGDKELSELKDYIHEDKGLSGLKNEKFLNKIMRRINEIFNKNIGEGTIIVENVEEFSKKDIRRGIVRNIENG